jgi:hypothetical protein
MPIAGFGAERNGHEGNRETDESNEIAVRRRARRLNVLLRAGTRSLQDRVSRRRGVAGSLWKGLCGTPVREPVRGPQILMQKVK